MISGEAQRHVDLIDRHAGGESCAVVQVDRSVNVTDSPSRMISPKPLLDPQPDPQPEPEHKQPATSLEGFFGLEHPSAAAPAPAADSLSDFFA
eukprot:COSAG02_NODE_6365_length_3622_cov_2.598354_2_plen_93_part_00